MAISQRQITTIIFHKFLFLKTPFTDCDKGIFFVFSIGYSLEKTSVAVCNAVRTKIAIAQKITAPFKFPESSNLSITSPMIKVTVIPPISDMISLFAVKRPRFSSSISDINQVCLGEFTIELTIFPSNRKRMNRIVFPAVDKGKKGVIYTKVKAS